MSLKHHLHTHLFNIYRLSDIFIVSQIYINVKDDEFWEQMIVEYCCSDGNKDENKDDDSNNYT